MCNEPACDEYDVLDEQDIADIRESLEQLKRGEVVDWREFSAPWRERFAAGSNQVDSHSTADPSE